MKPWLVVLVLAACVACGGRKHRVQPVRPIAAHPATHAERILGMLPQGAQVVVEVDLARLRANPVVGHLVTRLLGEIALPKGVEAPPLAGVDTLVLAAYGVGTSQAATITIVSAKQPVAGATPLADGIYGLGPPEWLNQVEARAGLVDREGQPVAVAAPELLALRDHAMPVGAPGASLRVTARLAFDARVSLARQIGVESAPAQLSIWADVVDDFAMIVDCDATDPGEKKQQRAGQKMANMLRGALGALAEDPKIRALGLPSSLAEARLIAKGAWVRTIVAVGPTHLKRVVERAETLLGPAPAPAPANPP
ncbi:MAG TPA: hypothetical protein VFQ53_23790 [Kofleriaceae bacterium]|nr:hypothetical protein [Kofleriaceae bacterium]